MFQSLPIGTLVKKNDSQEVGVVVSIHQSEPCGIFYEVMFPKGFEILDEVLLTPHSKIEEVINDS